MIHIILFSKIIRRNGSPIQGRYAIWITGIPEATLSFSKHNPFLTFESFIALLLDSETVVRSRLVVAILKQKLVAFSCNLLERIIILVCLEILDTYHWLVPFYVTYSFRKAYLFLFFFWFCFSLSLLGFHCSIVYSLF